MLGKWTQTNDSVGFLGTKVNTYINTFGSTGIDMSDDPVDWAGSFPFIYNNGFDAFSFKWIDTSISSAFWRGLDPTASIRITMRWTMDMVVRPGSIYAPFTKMPPVEDHLALKMYAEVSRRMNDGYPASYNNLAALLPVIGKIAKAVLPTLAGLLPSFLNDRSGQLERANKPMGLIDIVGRTIQRMTADGSAPAGSSSEVDMELQAYRDLKAKVDQLTQAGTGVDAQTAD